MAGDIGHLCQIAFRHFANHGVGTAEALADRAGDPEGGEGSNQQGDRGDRNHHCARRRVLRFGAVVSSLHALLFKCQDLAERRVDVVGGGPRRRDGDGICAFGIAGLHIFADLIVCSIEGLGKFGDARPARLAFFRCQRQHLVEGVGEFLAGLITLGDCLGRLVCAAGGEQVLLLADRLELSDVDLLREIQAGRRAGEKLIDRVVQRSKAEDTVSGSAHEHYNDEGERGHQFRLDCQSHGPQTPR